MVETKKFAYQWARELEVIPFHTPERPVIHGINPDRKMTASEFIAELRTSSFEYRDKKKFKQKLNDFSEKYDVAPEEIEKFFK